MDALKMLSEAAIDKGVYNLSEDEKTYFKLLISHMVRSFSDPDYRCVLVVGMNKTGAASVCTVNASEEAAAELLSYACGVMSFSDTAGTPPAGELH